MSNPEEDTLLSTEDYQNKLVQGMANGIDKYFENQ
jgi:N-acetylmuramoyl-L-alanine amidase